MSRYLDDLLNVDNPNFAQMVSQIYPTELQLNMANPSDTEGLFWTKTCPLQMAWFQPKFMINGTTLILK